MKRICRKRKQHNKGFSLVEVLVTILIVALLCTPLIKSFVVSANVNKKAKRIQNATDAAQSVAEYFSANPLSALKKLVDDDDYSEIKDPDGNNVITYNNVRDWRKSASSGYFEGAGGEKFYIDVTMTGRKDSYNVPALKDFYGNNSISCMFQIYKYDKEAQTRLKGYEAADGSGIKKTCDLYVDIDGDSYNYYVTVTYTYGAEKYITDEMVLATGTIEDDKSEFPSLFVAYEPYDKISMSDKIKLHYNQSALDKRKTNVYIIQQTVSGTDGDVWLNPSSITIDGPAVGGLVTSDISNFKINNPESALSVESNITDTTGSSVTAGSGQKLKLYDVSISVKYGSADGETIATVSTVREEVLYD